MDAQPERRSYLKRLPETYYCGAAWIHWVMTINGRETGWLDTLLHARLRVALLHTFARYHLVCPVYTLMPDHAHFMWCGCEPESDQRRAGSFFRRQWNQILGETGHKLQKQGFDHVLTNREKDPNAFQETCVYIMKNPERAGLVQEWRAWEFAGSVIPGVPWVDPREDRFWPKFWSAYNGMRNPATAP